MVKLRGPAMSLAASGSFGKLITYGQALGRPWARRLVKPGNPQTGAQISMRAAMKFLSQTWSTIPSFLQDTWNARAEADAIAAYHAFCGLNAQRNRDFLTPSLTPTILTPVPVSNLDDWAAVAGVREITLELSSDLSQAGDWGFAIYSSTTPAFTAAYNNLIAMTLTTGATSVFFTHGPLEPNTYYYDARIFAGSGSAGTLAGVINATIP